MFLFVLLGQLQFMSKSDHLINYCIGILDGNWGAWSSLSTCTVTCGGGTQSHTRLCNNPPPSNGGAACPGLGSESVACKIQQCPTGKKIHRLETIMYAGGSI